MLIFLTSARGGVEIKWISETDKKIGKNAEILITTHLCQNVFYCKQYSNNTLKKYNRRAHQCMPISLLTVQKNTKQSSERDKHHTGYLSEILDIDYLSKKTRHTSEFGSWACKQKETQRNKKQTNKQRTNDGPLSYLLEGASHPRVLEPLRQIRERVNN